MHSIGNVDWFRILHEQAAIIEKRHDVRIIIDEAVCLEVGRVVADHLAATGLERPNVAKIAGQVTFWARKLKPLRLAPDSPNYLSTLNELAGLLIGLAICNLYKDDCSRTQKIILPPCIFRDWVNSLRYHSHSPHSSMISFELLMCAD